MESPSSYTTTGRSWLTPAARIAAWNAAAVRQRVPSAGPGGAARSRSRSTKTAPGRWPCAVAVDAGGPGAPEPPPHVEQHRRAARRRPAPGRVRRADQRAERRGHECGKASAGTSCSDEVSEPCMPTSADSRARPWWRRWRRAGRRRHHVPDPAGQRLVRRAEPAVLDGLVPGHHPGALAEDLPPGGEHVGRGAGRAYRCLARGSPPSSAPARAQLRDRVDVDPVIRADVHHAVIGGHVEACVPMGSAPAICSASLSTCASWYYQASEPTPNTCPVASRSPWYTVDNARPFES